MSGLMQPTASGVASAPLRGASRRDEGHADDPLTVTGNAFGRVPSSSSTSSTLSSHRDSKVKSALLAASFWPRHLYAAPFGVWDGGCS